MCENGSSLPIHIKINHARYFHNTGRYTTKPLYLFTSLSKDQISTQPENMLMVLCLAQETHLTNPITVDNKNSLLMLRIKIKSPANSLYSEQNVSVGGIISFQSVLTVAVLQWQKAYRILVALPFKMSASSLPWSLESTPWQWAYTSNFVQYISGL